MKHYYKYLTILAIYLALLITSINNAYSQENCGSLHQGYGPFNYYTVSIKDKTIVEDRHFTSEIENLKATTHSLRVNLSYTLRSMPNHPRALFAMMKLQHKKPPTLRDLKDVRFYSMECWFDRAHRMAPSDGVIYKIEGIYYHKKKDYQMAINNFLIANKKLKNDVEVYYNLGLSYFELGDFGNSRKFAAKAYDLNFPLQALKKKLLNRDNP